MRKLREKALWKEAKRLASRPYEIEVVELDQEERKRFPQDICVTNPELPGCFSEGESWEEAQENLSEARELYIYTLLKAGEDVPTPRRTVELNSNILINFANLPPLFIEPILENKQRRSEFAAMKVR